MRSFLVASLMMGLAFGQWQEESMLERRQGSLDTLESMGIQLLSSILSPSADSSSTTSSASATSSSSSASTTSSASATSSLSSRLSSAAASASASAAAATTSPTPSSESDTSRENTRHRNIAIIVGSVLGAVVLLLALALLICCFMRRRKRSRAARGRSPEKIIDDDDELDGLNGPGGPGMAYVTRIESWHEPRTSRNSSRGPPKGSQSRVSLVQRDAPPERFNNGPGAPVPIPVPPPHRSSSYGLIQNDSPYDAPQQGAYFDRPHRHSMDDATRDPNRYPGYVPYRSTHSLVERSPTPLFGSGKTHGEVQPQHTIKRKSVGSTTGGPTAVNTAMNSKDPSPYSTGNGPFVPPKSRRRESLPGSPLQHEFEFGFENQNNSPRRFSGARMPGSWNSNNSMADAHQRF